MNTFIAVVLGAIAALFCLWLVAVLAKTVLAAVVGVLPCLIALWFILFLLSRMAGSLFK